MKHSILRFIVILILFQTGTVTAQITGVKYMTKYNDGTENLDIYIVVTEGSATQLRQRVQLNAQFSFVVPTGLIPIITKNYMPINDNQNYDGEKPCTWEIRSQILSPETTPQFDYFSVVPKLDPSSFYNNIHSGDSIKLFSLGIKGDNSCIQAVRLYENESDPSAFDVSMKGADFTNTFTIGSLVSVYKGNISHGNAAQLSQKSNELMVNLKGKNYEWYHSKDNKLVAETNLPVFLPPSDGQFYVRVVNDNCAFTSDPFKFKSVKLKTK